MNQRTWFLGCILQELKVSAFVTTLVIVTCNSRRYSSRSPFEYVEAVIKVF